MNSRHDISEFNASPVWYTAHLFCLLAVIALAAAWPASTLAEECPVEEENPKVTVAPSPIYVSGTGPWDQALSITIDLIDSVPSYDTLDVKFDGDTAYSGTKPTPPAGNTVCTNKTGGAGTCAPGTTDNEVVISYDASFSEIRSYSVEVNATKSGPNDVCETAFFVVLEFVAVEYKAPPAIANEYINGNAYYSSLAPKRRGCVISTIASNHAKDSKYGPKGGDGDLYPGTGYNAGAIHADVDNYFGGICVR